MISNLNKSDLEADEIESIGTAFATSYFDALMGKPNASALRQFYNNMSKYVFVQPGRPDYEMESLFLIGRFLKRMEYSKCTVTIRSVATTRRAHPTEFKVSSVCELSRPGDNAPRTFDQSFVVKRVPWTTAQFQIAVTEFKFDDDTVDYSIPIVVGDKPKGSRAIRTNTCNKLDNPMVVSGKRTVGNPKVFGKPVDRVGKLKNHSKKPTTRSIPAGSGFLNGKVLEQTSPRRTEKKFNRGTAMVFEKSVTEKPIITMAQPVANNTFRDESKKPIMQMTVNKAVIDKGRKDIINVQRAMTVRPANGERTTFVSSNRYGSLAVVDENVSSDVQETRSAHHRSIDLLVPTAASQDTPNEANGRSKKSRRNRKKNGCKRTNGGVAPKAFNEVVVTGPHYSYIRYLGQSWTFIKEFVYPIFFD